MISQFFKVTIAIFCICHCASAKAQDSKLEARIKRKVFGDCAKAEADAAALTDQNKRDLVPYLGRVLELKLTPSTSLAVEATKIEKPQALTAAVYPDGSDLWRTFDPDHERQAKQCALKILARVHPAAIGEIAKVLTFALSFQNSGAEKEVEDILVLARQIMQSGREQVSPEIEREALIDLLQLRAETRSNIIDEFVTGLAPYYPDILAEELLNSARDRRLYAVRLFSRLSVDDRKVGDQLIVYFNSADELARREIAAVLAGYELDEIRIQFIRQVLSDLSRGAELDGEIANSFTFAVRSLPKESLRSFSDSDKANIEKVFLTGKVAALLQPLLSKLFETQTVSREILRQGLRSEIQETRKVSLQLVDDLTEGRDGYFAELSLIAKANSTEDMALVIRLISVSSVPAGKKTELFSNLILDWAKLPVANRPNGLALSATEGLLPTKPSMKILSKVVAGLFVEVEAALKNDPKKLSPGLREQIQVIGMIGSRTIKLVPKQLLESRVPELQESLLKGLVSEENIDPQALIYLKQLNKRGALPEPLLKSFPETIKVNIVSK